MDYYSNLDKLDEELYKLFLDYQKKRDQLMEDFHAGMNQIMGAYRHAIDFEMIRREYDNR
jgi:hypothetical protein